MWIFRSKSRFGLSGFPELHFLILHFMRSLVNRWCFLTHASHRWSLASLKQPQYSRATGSQAIHLKVFSSRYQSAISLAMTRVLMKIFNTRSRDIIEQSQLMFDMLPVADQIFMRKVRFLLRFKHSENFICQQCFAWNYIYLQKNTRPMRLIYACRLLDALPLDVNRFRLVS